MGYDRDKSRQVIEAALRDGQRQGLTGRGLEAHAFAACPFRMAERERMQIFKDELRRQMRPFVVEPETQAELF